MTMPYNAAEVLEMAIQMERNGAAFYRKAAALRAGRPETDVLRRLAAMENQHVADFEALRAALPASGALDPADESAREALLYLDAIAGAQSGEGAEQVTAALGAHESLDAILQTAILLEQRAVLFYVGLAALVPLNLGRSVVLHILDQERGHVAVLEAERRRLRP
jgi:rubrerythrin